MEPLRDSFEADVDRSGHAQSSLRGARKPCRSTAGLRGWRQYRRPIPPPVNAPADATDGASHTSDENHGEAESRQTFSAEIPVDPASPGRAAAVGRATGSEGDRALAEELSHGPSFLLRMTAAHTGRRSPARRHC